MFEPTAHPILKLPTAEEAARIMATPGGREKLAEVLVAREQAIKQMASDPWRYGYKHPSWLKMAAELRSSIDELLEMGGNRSAKTEFAAWYAVDDLVNNSNREWAFLHSSHDSSIRLQQSRVYRYLPPEWRDLGKQGKLINVSYTAKTGFSDQIFILPNGSRAYFFNYQQDVKILEGYELDGAWPDELVPVDFVEALRYRLITRRGKMLITFTPVEGYSQTVADYLAGAEVITSERAPLLAGHKVHVKGCPPGEMPREMLCINPRRKVFFAFTSDNPFNPYGELVKKLDGASEAKIKERAYGWPEKRQANAFPKFGKVHVVPASKIPKKLTRYRAADPGVSKNWFIKWYGVDDLGRTYIYREWPDFQRYGAWAVPCSKNPDGRPGPAQRAEYGRGIKELKRLILELEGWQWNSDAGEWDGSKAEVVVDGVIDPRMGGAEVPSDEENKSLIILMEQEQTDGQGRVLGPSMVWRPGKAGRIADGLELINDMLDWNEADPVSVMNSPQLFISEDCLQSIYAYREFTGLGGETGALKDVVDPDRYFVKMGWGYIDENLPLVRGGGYGGY